ncbi:UDP-2,4-diacetamido-2,4,6-trideoxy-beta-L-altropyranose hydrolase [Salibacterium sp. K-3]
MNILIRTDSSFSIGSGHVMRCITLARILIKQGHSIVFVCREYDGSLNDLIASEFQLVTLPYSNEGSSNSNVLHEEWLGKAPYDDARETLHIIEKRNMTVDWIIADHYGIDESWESILRPYVKFILIIDDLADRAHDCDILLDQNFYQNMQHRYNSLLPDYTLHLLGPRYALLRGEFLKEYPSTDEQSLLIFYGGTDPSNETMKALKALENTSMFQRVDVVVGPSNPNKEYIEEYCNASSYSFHYNIRYMAALMAKADIALCAGGSTTWERYAMGTPGFVTSIAPNQVELCRNAETLGVDRYLGHYNLVSELDIQNAIFDLSSIKERQQTAREIVDGKGAVRVIDYINHLSYQ